MKIRSKLISSFGVMAFLVIIVGYVGYYGVNEIFEEFDLVADETAPELAVLGQIESLSYRMLLETVSFVILHSEDEDAHEEFEEFEETNKKLDQAIIQLQKLEKEEEEETEELFIIKVVELKGKLYDSSLNLINTVENNGGRQAILELKSELEELEEEFSSEIEARIEQEKDELVRRDNIADQLASDINNFVTIIAISGIILAVNFAIIISGRLSKSVINLRNVAKEIASGNLNARAKVEGNDEISHLSSEINKMAKNLLQQKQELIKNEKINALGSVTSSLAHNLKNPLSVIKAVTSIIEATPNSVDEKTQERLNLIKVSTENMLNQIEDILDFVKQKPLELKETSLFEILDIAINNIEKPERIKINLPENDIKIKCDSSKLQVVFMNMITNSIESIEGNGEITIASYQNMRETAIEITDSGSLNPSEFEKMFDVLYTTKPTGTGLGLPYCKSAIDQHGGNIEVSMNPTKFTIIIPLSIKPLLNLA